MNPSSTGWIKKLLISLEKQNNFLKDDGGFLESRLEGLDTSLATIEKSKADLEFSMERLESRLLKQFNSIDSQVGQLNNLGDFLENALASLPLANKND